MIDEMTTVLEPSPLPDFVETKYIKDITNRTLSYIKAGFPVHFRGSLRYWQDNYGNAYSK